LRRVHFNNLGLINFQEAWNHQEQVFQTVVAHKLKHRDTDQPEANEHHLLFCEHKPVITIGKSGDTENLLITKEGLEKLGISYHKINRGGDITFHGPGQLVGYPILDLDEFFTDIHKYMRYLEEVIIQTIAEYGLTGTRLQGSTGVWLDVDSPSKVRKICAMGVRASRWVTMHGWALNVNTNLDYFQHIIPCGIGDKQVTSMQKELGEAVDFGEVSNLCKEKFEQVFDCTLI